MSNTADASWRWWKAAGQSAERAEHTGDSPLSEKQIDKLKSVLYGTGGWAGAHVQAYAYCTHVELSGICTHSNAANLRALAQDCSTTVLTGLDLAEMLKAVEPDILDVSCNPHFRVEPVRVAAGCPSVKLINLEKPLALTPREAYEIERLCRENGILLTINHQKKFLPSWRKLREVIEAGVLGDISLLRATCQGNLLEQGTHLIDMLLYYNGYSPVSWVMGQVGDLEGLGKEASAAPDSAVAVLCFENGIRGLLEVGNIGRTLPGETNKWQQFAIEVFGSMGNAVVTLNRTLRIITYADGHVVTERSSWDDHYIEALRDHLDSLADYIRTPAAGHISDLDKSLLSFNTVMAVYASACHGGKVDLPARFEDRLLDDFAK